MKLKNEKKLKGSGVLVVIFASITTSIYMISTFADYEHFNIQVEKYKNSISAFYSKKLSNLDSTYNSIEQRIKIVNNFNLE